jgi:hypothetical protein
MRYLIKFSWFYTSPSTGNGHHSGLGNVQLNWAQLVNWLALHVGVAPDAMTATQRLICYIQEERGMYKKMKVGEQLVYLARLK